MSAMLSRERVKCRRCRALLPLDARRCPCGAEMDGRNVVLSV
jgi:ribosomal protein L40E